MSKQSDLVSVSQGASGDPLYIDTTNDRVGIGTSSPSHNLHVSSSVGSTLALTAGSTENAQVRFGDSSDDDAGKINYDNSTNHMAFHTNASERMRIDSAGRVTMPYQPSFFCTNTSGDTITGSNQVVDGWSVQHNTGSHFDISTDRFTAPISGVYHFSFCIELADNFSNTTSAYIAKNGGQISSARLNAQPVTYRHSLTGAWAVLLSANDYITVNCTVSSGSTTLDNSGFFCGYLIG